MWHRKFKKKISTSISFYGCSSDNDIADKFVDHLCKTFYESYHDSDAVENFHHSQLAHQNNVLKPDITVELIDRSIHKLHKGKASGPDELSAEHLLNAHPSLVVHLKLLFSMTFCHEYVPAGFGYGTVIPLIKDKMGNFNDVNNYRPITLIPVISKVFECILLEIC